jgi:hypothetical protein
MCRTRRRPRGVENAGPAGGAGATECVGMRQPPPRPHRSGSSGSGGPAVRLPGGGRRRWPFTAGRSPHLPFDLGRLGLHLRHRRPVFNAGAGVAGLGQQASVRMRPRVAGRAAGAWPGRPPRRGGSPRVRPARRRVGPAVDRVSARRTQAARPRPASPRRRPARRARGRAPVAPPVGRAARRPGSSPRRPPSRRPAPVPVNARYSLIVWIGRPPASSSRTSRSCSGVSGFGSIGRPPANMLMK